MNNQKYLLIIFCFIMFINYTIAKRPCPPPVACLRRADCSYKVGACVLCKSECRVGIS
jgi:hypothetical protein